MTHLSNAVDEINETFRKEYEDFEGKPIGECNIALLRGARVKNPEEVYTLQMALRPAYPFFQIFDSPFFARLIALGLQPSEGVVGGLMLLEKMFDVYDDYLSIVHSDATIDTKELWRRAHALPDIKQRDMIFREKPVDGLPVVEKWKFEANIKKLNEAKKFSALLSQWKG